MIYHAPPEEGKAIPKISKKAIILKFLFKNNVNIVLRLMFFKSITINVKLFIF